MRLPAAGATLPTVISESVIIDQSFDVRGFLIRVTYDTLGFFEKWGWVKNDRK